MMYLKIPLKYLHPDDEGKTEEKIIDDVINTMRLPSYAIDEKTLPDLIEIIHE